MLEEEHISANTLGKLDAILAVHNLVVMPNVRRDLRSIQISNKWHYAQYSDEHVVTIQAEAERVFASQPGRFNKAPLDIAARFRPDDYGINALLGDLGLQNGMADLTEMAVPELLASRRVLGVQTLLPGITLNYTLEGRTGWGGIQVSLDQTLAVASVLSPVLPQLSDWHYDRDKYIEELLITYYNAVDGGDTEEALAIFSDDPEVRYVRGGNELVGPDRIREFYEKKRILFIGKHYLKPFRITENEAFVEGVYKGVVDFNRGKPNFRFTDHFVLRGAHVIRRESSFPDGEAH
ncbi:MAG: hypothetical protein G01um10147_1016 [Microgenomates group bacterium Gr01-1014_7]|nr:MAG: hypothetical protein G01um10147_1016 [Microgenomates group bacterium Gr01-1014_7]